MERGLTCQERPADQDDPELTCSRDSWPLCVTGCSWGDLQDWEERDSLHSFSPQVTVICFYCLPIVCCHQTNRNSPTCLHSYSTLLWHYDKATSLGWMFSQALVGNCVNIPSQFARAQRTKEIVHHPNDVAKGVPRVPRLTDSAGQLYHVRGPPAQKRPAYEPKKNTGCLTWEFSCDETYLDKKTCIGSKLLPTSSHTLLGILTAHKNNTEGPPFSGTTGN